MRATPSVGGDVVTAPRRFAAALAVLLLVGSSAVGVVYYRSPTRSIRSLASALRDHDLPAVERYADVNGLAGEVQRAIRYHAMLAAPRSGWTTAHELAMNETAGAADFAPLIRRYVERTADTDSFSGKTLLLLGSSVHLADVRDVKVTGDVATAIVLLSDDRGAAPCAVSLRRRGSDWQVMDADLVGAETALVKAHWAEIRAQLQAAQ